MVRDLESLSVRLHEIYQLEAIRQGDVRHLAAYADLTERIKDYDRVLARWILHHFTLKVEKEDEWPPVE